MKYQNKDWASDRALEIGRPTPRIDGLKKACGTERYSVDQYPAGLLWAGVKRAGAPHARIAGIDTSLAEKMPGVVRVLTRGDVPGTNRQGIMHKDQPVLAGTKVRHLGEPVALVLAEDREALRAAIDVIEMSLEPLPAVFDIDSALELDASLVHHGREQGNLLIGSSIITGQGKAALDDCPVQVSAEFTVPAQRHAFLENENGVAWQDPDGTLHMIVSTQAPFRDRFEISHALGLDPARIRVQAPYLGGGFGGKDGATVQCLLALAAMHAHGRPVKMCWNREESFQSGYTRHAARMRYQLGADRNGKLMALVCHVDLDTGAYAHLGGEVLALGMEHAGGPYRIPNVYIKGRAVYTNNPVAGAMRGFGVAQVSFGMERIMDILARKLSMDSLDLRRKNVLRRGDRNPCGVTLTGSTGIADCLDKLSGNPLWREKNSWTARAGRFKRRGVGLAVVHNAMGYGRGLPDSALAKIELLPDGKFCIYSAVADMGQGNATACAQIAGQILGQNASNITVVQPDTSRCHPSGSSSAGRTTYTFGNALIKACHNMKDKLLARAAMFFFLEEPKDLVLVHGNIRHLPTGRDLPLSRLGSFFSRDDCQAMGESFMPVAKDNLSGGKEFQIGFPHLLFAHAAHAAFVELDELTGQVQVCHYLAVTEAGRVLNPQSFEQQVHGAVAQGLGYALSEDMLIKNGRVHASSLATYIIPTAVDVPEIQSWTCDVEEPSGPFGMKGTGEVGMNGPLPAVANALYACGANIFHAPLTPERVLFALTRRKK